MTVGDDAKQLRADSREQVLEARAEAKVDAKADSLERYRQGITSISRWALGSSAVGSLGALPAFYFDKTGRAALITLMGTAFVGVYGSYRSQRAAGRKADMLAEAEGIRARIEAEGALMEARRLHDECEARYAELVRRFDKLESDHRAMEGKLDAIRESVDAERREHMAAMRQEHGDAMRKINEQLQRDNPKGRR